MYIYFGLIVLVLLLFNARTLRTLSNSKYRNITFAVIKYKNRILMASLILVKGHKCSILFVHDISGDCLKIIWRQSTRLAL